MSDMTSERLVERLESLEICDWEDGGEPYAELTATDLRDAIAEIRRLEEAVKRWKHEEETIWVPLDKKATRYREALERIRDAPLPQWNAKRIATRALEADHE